MPRVFFLLFLLAACGADGAPDKPGLTVSGDAQFGIVGN